MGKTKAQIAEEVRAEHLETAAGTPDEELKDWSRRVYADLKAADNALHTTRQRAQELDTARKDARSAHRRGNSADTSAAWRAAVVAAEDAQAALRTARDERNRLQALSELLAALLRQRRVTNNSEDDGGASRRAARAPAPPESCPFCDHSYTVRDGTLAQTDAEGNRLQLRKCQCREMAPPCRNCPTCKEDAAVMAASGEEQLRVCREDLRCEICACECPGAGKWIEGDADSRKRFRQRTARRHAELSALLNSSWSGGGDGAHPGGVAGGLSDLAPSLRRLPADIKNQLEAAAAAESLQFSAFGEGGPSASAATSLGCGRMCCGETLATVKRRKLDSSGDVAAAAAAGGAGTSCGDGCTDHTHHHHHEGHEHHHKDPAGAAEGDERHHHHHPHAHAHDAGHVHRCEHPHDECTSDCCSVVSHA